MRLNRRLRIACGLTIAVISLMIVSCILLVTTTPLSVFLMPWTPEPTPNAIQTQTPFLLLTVVGPLGIQTRADLEKYLKTSLPADVNDLQVVDYNIAIQEAAVNFRFKTKDASLDDFLRHLGFALPLKGNNYPFQKNDLGIIDYFPWWNPQDAKVYAGATVSKGPQEYWSVLVDKTDPNQYTVYFMAVLL